MADLVWPANFQPAVFEWGLRSNVIITTSTYTGAMQTSEIPGSRWIARIVLPQNYAHDGTQPVIDAFFAQLRGQANRISMPHLKRLAPRGTMRGTPTCSGCIKGATQTTVTGTGTLVVGDMLGLVVASGTQLVEVTAASGSDTVAVDFSPPARGPVSAASLVTWNAPRARFILLSPEVMIPYGFNANPGVALDLVEVF